MDTPQTPSEPNSTAALEIKAVLLLILMGSLLCMFVLYVMYARGVFEQTQQLVLVSDDSEGVNAGMDMTFSGFPIGRVQRTDLAGDGKVRISIKVPRKEAHWLRRSSVFTMERGLVGETRIRAFTGDLSDTALEDGAVRPVLRGDTSAEIPRLVAAAHTLLENLGNITASGSALNGSLANVQKVTKQLGGRYGLLGGAVGSEGDAQKVIAALDRVNLLLGKTDQRVFGQKGVMNDVQATVRRLNDVLTEARASLKKVDGVLAEAQAVGANAHVASQDLGQLRIEVDASLRKVNGLVDEVNRKWPFARDTELVLP